MRTKHVRPLVVAALVAGSLAGAPGASAGQAATPDRAVVEQLVYVESVFHKATPGSPAQFRAREAADALRERLWSHE